MRKTIFSLILIICLLITLLPTASADQSAIKTGASAQNEVIDEDLIYATETAAEEITKQIKAKSAVLMDADSGTVLMALNENQAVYPASVTKVMSLLLVCEALDSGKIKLSDSVSVSETAASRGGSQIWLEPGETMTVEELLKATAVYSANDACTALGEHIAGSDEAFVSMMNDKAVSLGMKNTYFENCTGLDDTATNHLTTALDVAVMSRALLQHPIITDYTTIWMDTLRNGETEIVNTNKLIRFYNGATGLKTGTTDKAGCCVSASANRNGLHLIAVVMGADNSSDRFEAAKTMLNWGFSNYESYKPVIDSSLFSTVQVIKGAQRALLPVCASEPEKVLLKKGSSASVTQKVELVESVDAPVQAGQKLGMVQFYSNDTLLSEIPLVAQEDIDKMSFLNAFVLLLQSFNANENQT